MTAAGSRDGVEGGFTLVTIRSPLLLRLFGWRTPLPQYVTASVRLWLFWLRRGDRRFRMKTRAAA